MSAQDICQHVGCGHPRSEHDDAGSCVAEFMRAPKSPECPCEGFMAPVEGAPERVTDAELAEVLRLDALATSGPWTHKGGRQVWCKPNGDYMPARTTEDARFIVFVRGVVAPMAREIQTLRASYAEHERKFEAGAGWFREMADRPMPCGHTIGDLIGGDGSVTSCGACLAARKPGVLRAHPPLREIGAERDRQIEKWGDGAPSGGFGPVPGLAEMLEVTGAQQRHDTAMKAGRCTMRHVLEEEVAEVFAEEPGSAKQRAELVQVAAVCVTWIELIDRGGK